jgi:hypothetical protein
MRCCTVEDKIETPIMQVATRTTPSNNARVSKSYLGALVQPQVWIKFVCMDMDSAIGMDIGRNVNHELTL